MMPVPFVEAIAWARARGVVLPDAYYSAELQGLARSMAFSIAGMAKLDQLQAVMDSLAEATENGETFATWKKRASTEALDLPAHRIECILRTNIQGHYGRGRCEQQARTTDDRPWYMLDAVNDNRTRPSHAALDGMTRRHDDPIWAQGFTPPLGYQCRCRRLSLSEAQAKRFIEADQRRLQDPEAAEARRSARPDKGWDYDPCAEPEEGLRRAWESKVGKAHPLLAQAAEQAAQTPPPAPPAWPIIEGDAATLDELKRLGGERLDELLDAVTPEDRKLIPAITDRGKRARDLNAEALLSAMPWWRDEMRRRLSEARPIGGAMFDTYNKSGKGRRIANRVASKLPDSWVSHCNSAGPIRVAASNARGFYSHHGWNQKEMRRERHIRTNDSSTAEHEFIHAVQFADPVLNAFFTAEHRRRTSNDSLEAIYPYTPKETGRPDKYVSRYQGREYGGKPLEVITMAMEPLLGDDDRANSGLSAMIRKDPEMLKLALGALFHYRPKQ